MVEYAEYKYEILSTPNTKCKSIGEASLNIIVYVEGLVGVFLLFFGPVLQV